MYQTHHSSYIQDQGRSAPSTPGILGRSSSRRALGTAAGAGLSRKLSIYDLDVVPGGVGVSGGGSGGVGAVGGGSGNGVNYAAVAVSRDGVPLSKRSGASVPKAKSEAALVLAQRKIGGLKVQQSAIVAGAPPRHHRRTRTVGRAPLLEDDWLSRTALATSTLLRESKGQSWTHSSSSLALATETYNPEYCSDDSDQDLDDETLARMSASGASTHTRLHFADDELSPETPRWPSRWGSRFGSRVPSARTSRRGSRVDLYTPLNQQQQDEDYFAVYEREESRGRSGGDEVVEPDFVDMEGEESAEDAEEEVARLARESRGFGLGGLVDRLVGWTLFSVDDDREGTDVEDGFGDEDGDGDDRTRTPRASVVTKKSVPLMEQVQQAQAGAGAQEQGEEGGWHDAAWLLSLATKVIL